MNTAQSLYGYEDWHLPSPYSTPQATRAKDGIPQFQSPTEIFSSASSVSKSNLKSQTPTISSTKVPAKRRNHLPASSSVESGGQVSSAAQVSLSEHNIQTNGNGLENTTWVNIDMISGAELSMQMQTPPPTRDSSKRKPQQAMMSFNVTPTPHTRRQSAPGEPWLKRNEESSFLDASPFSFTPANFSATENVPFANAAPATAPAYPQAGLFWDPNSHVDLNSINNTNDTNLAIHSEAMSFEQFPMSDPISQSHKQDGLIHRPQSAHAFGTTQTFNMNSIDGSVNPNMLWSAQGSDLGQIFISDAAPTDANSNGRQPYQFYFDQLKREKEERTRKHNAQVEISGAATLAGHTLRRGLSQLRLSRQKIKKKSSASSSEASEIQREGSPLKRHKSDANERINQSSGSSLRRSVILEVDDKGHARAVVKPILKATKTGSNIGAMDVDDESSNDDESRSQSTVNQDNAQDALRSMRGSKRKEGALDSFSNAVKALSANPPSGNHDRDPWNTVSQADTITDSDYITPEKMRHSRFSGNMTQCVCNNSVSNEDQFMIQCESCNNWLHVGCLGLNPHQMPPVFVCIFCTGNTPTVRGGRVRHYPGSSYAVS